MNSLKTLYQQKLQQDELHEDPRQQAVVDILQAILEQLRGKKRFWHKKYIKGLYLWGGVGIGKSMLIDMFYDELPFENKLRLHFHQFMRQVHERLRFYQGKKNPLRVVAKEFAKKARVLCFDEFMVHDITDAMILAGLLEELVAKDVCLITTSNVEPDKLYKYGLQRQRFLPAIALINEHTQVVHMDNLADYRKQYARMNKYFLYPVNQKSEHALEQHFSLCAGSTDVLTRPIWLLQREIVIHKQADGVIWFDFLTICSPPRSQEDYLVLTERYHTVIISELKQIKQHQDDLVTAFINLVDVFYDAKVRLILSSDVEIEKIYPKGRKFEEFERTKSRLIEMQSEDWQQQGTGGIKQNYI